MAATGLNIKPIIWEIDGYVREIGNQLYPKIIPSGINQIIYMFYDPVCNVDYICTLQIAYKYT